MKKNYLFFSNSIIIIIFLVIPLNLITQNIEYLFPTLPQYFFIYLINILLFLTFNYLIYFLFKKFLNNKIINNFLFFLLIWIIFNGLLFPFLGFVSELFELISNIRLRYRILLKILICLILFIFFTKSIFLRNNLKKILTTYISILLVFGFISLITKYDKKNLVEFNTFGKENFLVVSFDGINGKILKKIINNNNSLQKNFKNFTLYSNYTTIFPTTRFSLKSELTSTNELNKIKNEDLLINNKKIINNIYTYGIYDEFYLGNNKTHEGSFFLNDKTFFLTYLYRQYIFPSFSRWMTVYFYNKFEKNIVRENIYLFINFTKFLSFNFKEKKNFDFNKYKGDITNASLYELDYLFNSFSYDQNILTNNIYFLHFPFSHYRITYDRNCNFVESTDRYKYQSYYGNLEITKCVVKKMNFIIDKLKKKKIFDHTTIVFKGDHGKPIGYFENKYLNMKINGNIQWGPGRYNSFFMIKNNENNAKILFKDEIIMSNDIYYFFCKNIIPNYECIKNTKDNIYIPLNRLTFQNINGFEKFKVDRSKKLFKQLLEQNKLQ